MTPQQRKSEFDRLFETIPGRNIDRVRTVSDILMVRPNTVRTWRMTNAPRVIPELKLRVLAQRLGV